MDAPVSRVVASAPAERAAHGAAPPPARAILRPIRICRVIARLNVGGAALHVIQLTSGLDHLDHQRFEQLVVTGMESPGEASLRPQAEQRGVRPLVIPQLGRELAPRDDLVTLAKLYWLFRRWRPDIVETHTAKAGTLGRLAARLAGVPVRIHVFHGHVFHSYFSAPKTRLFLEIERALARTTTRIIALGELQRRELLDYGVGAPEKVISIPLGLDLAPFLGATQHHGRLRAELGLTGNGAGTPPPLVGFIGRLVPIKVPHLFLEAAAQILERVPQAQFVIAGGGELRPQLEAIASRPPLAGHVHFLGWRDDPAVILADLDVLLLTSDNEGMPTAIIEAMAAGVPVVATRVGGVPGLVEHGVTGLLAPKRDARALAQACIALLEDHALARRMGEAARTAAYPRYDRSTLLATMADLYTSLVAGHRA